MRSFDLVLTAILGVAVFSCASHPSPEATGGPAYWHSGSPAASANLPGSPSAEPPGPVWPQVVVSGSLTNLVYQPQIDYWDGHQVTARDAVAVQRAGQSEPTFGVVTLQAITLVDKPTKKVSLVQIRIVGGDFPSDKANSAEHVRRLRESFPKELSGLPLDQFESNFVIPPALANGAGQRLNNSPPAIIFCSKPAILIFIDGPPVYRPVPGTSLERALNSRALLLKDKTNELFLHLLDGYVKTANLGGPWTVAEKAPEGAAQAESQALDAATPVDLLDGRSDPTNPPPHLSAATAPVIYTSTKPAELILFDGPPDFVPIPGTRLLYVENTTGNVFKSTADQNLYVLLSGRWFRAASTAGPWQFVPPGGLPSDFTQIPDSSPKENVKASVPGTAQASEALIANSIPQSTQVALGTQMQKPQIDGPAKLVPIAGTPLYYVANSGTPILRVDEHSWYACQNGVWFSATSLDGPWTAASLVPAVIYTIPPSSPLHYLTYVQVYGATPQVVYEGYTPGYLGTEVEDGVVVYGTGYYYPPWVGVDWYGWPCTWGFGWGPCWTPWNDWCFDFGFGWGCGFGAFGWWHCHPFWPWWGCWNHHDFDRAVAWRHGASATTAGNIYHRSGAIASRPSPAFMTRPQLASHFGRAYNSRTGTLSAGQRAGVRNVYTSSVGQRPVSSWSRGSLNSPRPSVAQYGPYSRASAGRGESIRGFERAGIYGREPVGPATGSFGRGGYPGAYSRGGGYSHGGGEGRSGGGSRSGGGGHGSGGHN